MTAREFLQAHMHAISEVYLDHDASISQQSGRHICPCGMSGTEADWEQHVAGVIADPHRRRASATPTHGRCPVTGRLVTSWSGAKKPPGMARFSDDGIYRSWLRRELDPQIDVDPDRICLFIMLNPSTATATSDDPTIRRCKGFASAMGCGILEVVNLFDYRATNPAEMFAAGADGFDIIGPDNEAFITNANARADEVIAAWGNHAPRDRVKTLLDMTRMGGLLCLGTNANGSPKHPLYVPADVQIEQWAPNA